MEKIRCLVTGAGGGVGQGILKCLKRINDIEVDIIAADMSPYSAGLFFVSESVIVPPASDPNYICKMAELLKNLKVNFYIPGTDVELIKCLYGHREIKEISGADTLVVKGRAVEIGNDKLETALFLKEHGFDGPFTVPLSNENVFMTFQFPVIVKPRVGYRSIGVSIARNESDLRKRLLEGKHLVVQELIGSEDDEFTCTVVVHNGSVLGSVILQRTLRAGDTFRAMPVNNPRIDNYIRAVAMALGVEGSVNFQLRLDNKDKPKIFEINPRFSGTTPFCAMLGFNPVEAYIKAIMGVDYPYSIDFEKVILRHWEEIAAPLKTIKIFESVA